MSTRKAEFAANLRKAVGILKHRTYCKEHGLEFQGDPDVTRALDLFQSISKDDVETLRKLIHLIHNESGDALAVYTYCEQAWSIYQKMGTGDKPHP